MVKFVSVDYIMEYDYDLQYNINYAFYTDFVFLFYKMCYFFNTYMNYILIFLKTKTYNLYW